ncbi:MAG: helix-turn-helix transcriptional regulator [Candidatus Aquirickettsiella sp.]
MAILKKLHEHEKQCKRELSKSFLEYLDTLPTNKRLEQVESILDQKNLPTLDRRLTVQERKCLLLASRGKEVKEMASILGLSSRTVKYHRANIVKKLQVPNLMAAVAVSNQYCNIDKMEFYETILNIMDCHIYWKNTQGQYLWCNKKLAKIFGRMDVADIIGKTDYDL